MISQDRLQKSLMYLSQTDEPFANAKGLLSGLEDQLKTVEATEYLKTEGPQETRKSMARASEPYKEHLKRKNEAVYDYELLRNKRATEALVVDVWRSLNAARRSGQV